MPHPSHRTVHKNIFIRFLHLFSFLTLNHFLIVVYLLILLLTSVLRRVHSSYKQHIYPHALNALFILLWLVRYFLFSSNKWIRHKKSIRDLLRYLIGSKEWYSPFTIFHSEESLTLWTITYYFSSKHSLT